MLSSIDSADRAVLFALSHGGGGASGCWTLQQHLEACIKFCISVILGFLVNDNKRQLGLR